MLDILYYVFAYSIYQRWHQLYTSYDGPEELTDVADTQGYAKLDAYLPSTYVMENLEQLRVYMTHCNGVLQLKCYVFQV